MKRNLVRCPVCESNGRKEILGEVLDNDSFAILRFHQGTTIVEGGSMAVRCGRCGEYVYLKKRLWHEEYPQSAEHLDS